MIVYGDQGRHTKPQDVLASLSSALRRGSLGGIEAHGWLVAALIEAGQLAQALLDKDFSRAGRDRQNPAQDAMGLTVRLAGIVGRSWSSGFEPATEREPDERFGLSAALVEDRVLTLREPEGYTHYALYPEAYWTAGAAWPGGSQARVIGIRSIGTSLAAMVAARAGAPVPFTVRPVGPPFERRLDLDPGLAARLADPAATAFAIVDEGPGLSGSSFGAVADALEQSKVDPSRIVFFPSHRNEPGPQASARHRSRWSTAKRLVATFDDLVFDPQHPAHRLEAWVEDLTGKPLAPPRDISGGGWRALQSTDQTQWPPAGPAGERRKFILEGERGCFLLKFSGVGRSGLDRHALQSRLGAAGFTTAPSGWRHGFTIEPWRSDLRPLSMSCMDRSALVGQLAAYLAFRAKNLPAEGRSGASLEALLEMLTVNAAQALGPSAVAGIERWRQTLPALARMVHPVLTDNRLQAWEWLVSADGRILKTDAVDHHAGHDLIGCQDIAWDLAGARIEFGLAADEVTRLHDTVTQAAGRQPAPALVRFFELAYAAFQVGACDLAAGRSGTADRVRWIRQVERYRDALRNGLAQGGP